MSSTTAKSKSSKSQPLRIGWNIDPISIAAGNLNKALDRFTWINIDIRKGWVEEMKLLPYLTHLNMPLIASVLVLYDRIKPIPAIEAGEEAGNDIVLYLQQVQPRLPPASTKSVMGIDFTNQELYDEITRPLLEDIGNKNLTGEEINDVVIKMKASIFRYTVNLYNYRNEI